MESSEESARLWARREDEWRKEREARDALMQQVLNERRTQLEKKLTDLRKMQLETFRYSTPLHFHCNQLSLLPPPLSLLLPILFHIENLEIAPIRRVGKFEI